MINTLSQVNTSDIDRLLEKIPFDGTSIGNKAIRGPLGWGENRYDAARDLLVERGFINKGRGRGGSVFRKTPITSCTKVEIDRGPKLTKSQKTKTKENGVHYTPDDLADFMAKQLFNSIANRMPLDRKCVILDPACGEGALLDAFARSIPAHLESSFQLVGLELDPDATLSAISRMTKYKSIDCKIVNTDYFLVNKQNSVFDLNIGISIKPDGVISNPPYVRTQNLPQNTITALSSDFGLDGRIDLYHAFILKSIRELPSNGYMTFVTSNRFLVTQAGQGLRREIIRNMSVERIVDFGDTKLFEAAVLPVVFTARKLIQGERSPSNEYFARIYETKEQHLDHQYTSLFEALESDATGGISVGGKGYKIEKGRLGILNNQSGNWFLSNKTNESIIKKIFSISDKKIGEKFKIRVGIKSTADNVFIKDGWNSEQIESSLIFPLIDASDCQPWLLSRAPSKKILYTHEMRDDKRVAIDIEKYPRAKDYLEKNRKQLEGRDYVAKAGRKWFEIWVPQQPNYWTKDLIIFPDISEKPSFTMHPAKSSPVCVNGNCYFIVLEEDEIDDGLITIAFCNSKLSVYLYDSLFNNKLYAGKRRFITQYIEEYPFIPSSHVGTSDLLKLSRELTHSGLSSNNTKALQEKIDVLVCKLFSLSEAEIDLVLSYDFKN